MIVAERKKGYYRFWLGVGISLIFLFLAVRQVQWQAVLATILQANPVLLAAGTLFAASTYAVFAVRWRVLLSATKQLSIQDTFSFIMIGYIANTVLPLRLGDVARAALLGRYRHMSASLVFGSIMLERVLDVLTVLVLALGLSFTINIPPVVRTSMIIFTAGALAALGGLVVLSLNESRLPGLAARVPTYIPNTPVERMLGLVARFASGVSTLRDVRQLAASLLLSCLAWAIAGMWIICYVAAFNLPVPWYAGLFVLAVANLGGAIPSSPGAIGVYHYLAMLALSVWMQDKNAMAGYAIASHGLNIAIIIVLGGVSLWREGIGLAKINQMKSFETVDNEREILNNELT